MHHQIAGLFLIVLGSYFCVLGVRGSRQGRTRTATATGIVVAQDVGGARGGAPLSFPVVKVNLPGVGERTVRGSNGRTPPAHSLGDSLTVTYDPKNPDDAVVGSAGLVTGVATLAGVVLVVIGAVVAAL